MLQKGVLLTKATLMQLLMHVHEIVIIKQDCLLI